MILFEDVVISFIGNLNDYLMILVTFLGSLVLFLISPILNLINISRTKSNFGEPKTVIITGATSGIGKSLAISYAKKGILLGLTGRNVERLEEVKQECIKKGATVEAVAIDITDKEGMEKWLLSFDKKNTVDILIANAAVNEFLLPKELSFNERTYKLIDTNVNGCLNTVLPLIPLFESRGTGQIVIVSSLTCYLNFVLEAYTASKAFTTSFGLTLRNRLSEFGVGVSVVAPGFVETPMSGSLQQKSLPFSVSSETAAEIIKSGVSTNKAFIAFSKPTLLFTYFVSLIPPNFKDAWNFISSFFFKHPEYIPDNNNSSSSPSSSFTKNTFSSQSSTKKQKSSSKKNE